MAETTDSGAAAVAAFRRGILEFWSDPTVDDGLKQALRLMARPPTDRALDDVDERVIAELRRAGGRLVRANALYVDSRASGRMERRAFQRRLQRLRNEGRIERIGHSYRILAE